MAYQDRPAALFSGGLNLRDSYEQMEPNQSYDLLNVAFDNKGGVKSRPGYAQFGPTTMTNGAVSSGASTITVDSTDNFASAGSLKIGSLTVAYTGKTSTTFTGCTDVTAAIADNTTILGSAPNTYDSLAAYYTTGGTKHLVAGAGNRLEVMDVTGAAVSGGLSTSPTASPHYFARFGGPTDTFLFAANGTNTLRRWNGSAWDATGYSGGVTPTGKYVSVTPWDNRLVNARYGSTGGGNNPSTVRFSDPSLPLVWQTDNWVDLTPGDGEQIMGVASFNNYLIVFKESHFFTFYGTSLASDGTPEFNYRAVEAGVGLASANAFCVAPDGVYFLADNGVYRTDGGLPVLVSGLIDPLFTGSIPPLYGGSQVTVSGARMAYHNLQVFVAAGPILMYDLRNQSWTVWDIPATAMCELNVSGDLPSLVFSYGKKIGRLSTSLSTDDGANIYSKIKVAFNDLGEDNHKTIRESKVWGTGIVRFGIADDFGTAENVAQVSFGAAPDKWADGNDPDDKWAGGDDPNDLWANSVGTHAKLVRTSVRGTYLSIELYSQAVAPGDVSPAWSVNRVVHHMRERRVPSVTNLDGE